VSDLPCDAVSAINADSNLISIIANRKMLQETKREREKLSRADPLDRSGISAPKRRDARCPLPSLTYASAYRRTNEDRARADAGRLPDARDRDRSADRK